MAGHEPKYLTRSHAATAWQAARGRIDSRADHQLPEDHSIEPEAISLKSAAIGGGAGHATRLQLDCLREELFSLPDPPLDPRLGLEMVAGLGIGETTRCQQTS